MNRMHVDFTGLLYTELSLSIADLVFTCILDTGFFYSDRMTYEPHMHADYELHICTSGIYRAELLESGTTVSVPAGSVLILPPQCYHNTVRPATGHSTAETPAADSPSVVTPPSDRHAFRLRIAKGGERDTGRFDRLSAQLKLPQIQPLPSNADVLLDTARAELSGQRIGGREMAAAAMQMFLVQLLRALDGTRPVLSGVKSLSQNDSNSARETKMSLYLDRSYMEPVTEAQLAAHLNLSLRQTSRLFSAYYGMTFREKLTEVRLNHACKLLSRTSLSAEEIACRVGYSAPSAFFVAFRRKFNMTPTAWRKARHKS